MCVSVLSDFVAYVDCISGVTLFVLEVLVSCDCCVWFCVSVIV